jgi:hypothetical protein
MTLLLGREAPLPPCRGQELAAGHSLRQGLWPVAGARRRHRFPPWAEGEITSPKGLRGGWKYRCAVAYPQHAFRTGGRSPLTESSRDTTISVTGPDQALRSDTRRSGTRRSGTRRSGTRKGSSECVLPECQLRMSTKLQNNFNLLALFLEPNRFLH